MKNKFNVFLPRLLLLFSIAIVSTHLAEIMPPFIGKVFIAVILCILISNIFSPSKKIFGAGIKFGAGKLLKLGIISMGATVIFQDITKLGLPGLAVMLALMLIVVLVTFFLGRLLKVSFRRKLLIAAGVCICGNSAIVATAPAIEAEEEEVAMAVSIITLFGVLGVVFYPIVGKTLEMSDTLSDAWAGTGYKRHFTSHCRWSNIQRCNRKNSYYNKADSQYLDSSHSNTCFIKLKRSAL